MLCVVHKLYRCPYNVNDDFDDVDAALARLRPSISPFHRSNLNGMFDVPQVGTGTILRGLVRPSLASCQPV